MSEKAKTKNKISLKVLFRIILLQKRRVNLLPYPWLFIVGCLIGLGGYYLVPLLYDVLSHILFGILIGPVILVFILLFEFVLSFTFALRIRLLPYTKQEAILKTEEDYEKDLTSKKSIFYPFAVKLVYMNWVWRGFSHFLPLHWLAFLTRVMGAKIGKKVGLIEPGTIMDPEITEIGENTTIGYNVVISGHLVDGVGKTCRFVRKGIKIGKGCLIGAGVMIAPGVIIGDNVTIGAGSIVAPNITIPSNSVWVGIPARMVKSE